MRKWLFITLFAFVSNAYSMSCFTEEENNRNLEEIKSNNEFYGDVHSIADCNNLSPINKIVCDSDELKNGVLLMSQGEVYAYENATKSEISVSDRITFNDGLKNWLNNLVKSEKNKDIALRKLCYVIKTKLSNDFGGDFYYEPKIHEVMSRKINQNGVVVYTLNTVIYLGKSCDAIIGSSDEKGIWYNDGDQFVIAEPDEDGKFKEKYRFNHDDKVAQLNCQKPTN